MSKITRKARAKEARRGTVAADPRIDIDDTPVLTAQVITLPRDATPTPSSARLAEEELAQLPVFVVRSSRRVMVWRGANGRWWRRGGTVRIQRWPTPDGPRAFVIFLHKGANEGDLGLMLHYVKRARTGVGFDVEWRQVKTTWADSLTFAIDASSREYEDPYTHSDPGMVVDPCSDALCVRKWHTEYDAHERDDVRRKLPLDHGGYDIKIQREIGDESPWVVDVHIEDFYGSPDEVAGLVSDLHWAQAECRRANELARTQGETTPPSQEAEAPEMTHLGACPRCGDPLHSHAELDEHLAEHLALDEVRRAAVEEARLTRTPGTSLRGGATA